MKFVSLLFSFEGRIGRGQFWLATAIYVAITLLIVGASLTADSGTVSIVLQLLLGVPCLISLVAVGIKRLHDRNKSAWWLLLFYLVPGVLPWIGMLSPGGGEPDSPVVVAMVYVRFAIVIWALVELGCLRGTIGGNPYGADPVAPKPAVH